MQSETPASVPDTAVATEFVVGITGHRDLDESDKGRIRDGLQRFLGDLVQQVSGAPLVVATGLAAGADSLAAEVALDMGLPVLAVLPMPLADYRADFDAEGAQRLEAFLRHKGVRLAEVPALQSDLSQPEARRAQYEALGDFLIRRSNLLVALWDGIRPGLPGGTADVALRYLGGGDLPVEVGFDPAMIDGCGSALAWLPARRAGGAAPADPSLRFLVSDSGHACFWQSDRVPQDILHRWRGFSEFSAACASSQGRELAAYGLAEDGKPMSPDQRALNEAHMRADQLARSFQTRSSQMFALFALLAGGMGLAFLVYAKLFAEPFLLVLYIAFFALGFLAFRYSARQHLHGHHLVYRVLAETFRVQFFLVLTGAGQGYDLRRILRLTSIDRFNRFEWLHEAIRGAEPVHYVGHAEAAEALTRAREDWIEDQAGYFGRKLHRLHAQHHRLEQIKTALLFGSVLGALALLFFKKELMHTDMVGHDAKSWLVFLMGLLPLWAAIWELYQGKMATRELLWQYTNQRRYFSVAAQEVAQAATAEEGQRILRDLADRALVEIYLWSVHRYHREHEPPAAG